MSLSPDILLRVMFIDAGPTRSAWVIVEVRSDGSVVPVQGSWRSMTDQVWLAGVMEWVWAGGGVVGLEYINGGLYDPKRWFDLAETLRVEGDIRTSAKIAGGEYALLPFREMRARHRDHPRTLFCVPASSWRQELLYRKSPKDAEIEVVVRYLCGRTVMMPQGPQKVLDLPAARDADAAEHIVDALGGAIVLASTILGVRIKVPDAIRQEQEQARAAAARGKGIRRTLDRLGANVARASMADGTPVAIELKKRRPSRGVRKMRAVTGANTKASRRAP